MVQEPYIGGIGEMKSHPGTRVVQCARKTEKVNKAAIVLFDDTIDLTQCPTLTTENFAVAKLRTGAWEIGVVSVYLDGGQPIEPDLDHLKKIAEEIGVSDVILGGMSTPGTLGGEVGRRIKGARLKQVPSMNWDSIS